MSELETIRFKTLSGGVVYCPSGTWLDPMARVVCRRRDCPRCGFGWAQAQGTKSFVNLDAYRGPVQMIAVTPPGVELLPWDREHCAQRAPHKCSGPAGCRIEPQALEAWASTLTARWAKLRDAARKAAVRRTELAFPILERVWEPQKRGAAHCHIVVGAATGPERTFAKAFHEELERLAPEYGFGSVHLGNPIPARDAARYLTSYLLGRQGRAKKPSIRENIADPRLPRQLVWVSRSLTKVTCCTIRILRRARWYFMAKSGRASVLPALHGDEAVNVARYVVYCARQRGRWKGDDDDPDDFDNESWNRWEIRLDVARELRTIRLMRALV